MRHFQFSTDLPPHAKIAGVLVGLSPTQQRPRQQMTVGGRNSKRTSVRQSHDSVRSRKAISQADRSPFAKVALFTSGPTRLTLPGGGSELTIVFEFFPKKHQLQNRQIFYKKPGACNTEMKPTDAVVGEVAVDTQRERKRERERESKHL